MIASHGHPPFAGPEPRVRAGIANNERTVPLDGLAEATQTRFGIVAGVAYSGVDTINRWMTGGSKPKACAVVVVHAACATLIDALNVADDALVTELGSPVFKDRCEIELGLLGDIEQAAIAPGDRCNLVCCIFDGDAHSDIEEMLNRKVKCA